MKSAFGVSESEVKDLWNKYDSMNPEQLQYIYKAQFNNVSGILALLNIFMMSRPIGTITISSYTPNDQNYPPDELFDLVYRRLKGFSKSECVCMGQGIEFVKIRDLLGQLLDKPDLNYL